MSSWPRHGTWRDQGEEADGPLTLSGQSAVNTVGATLRLEVLPLHGLARDVPELDVLQLPFFYPDIKAVHRALDGELGEGLKGAARGRGWEILDFWDEGMQVMSGNLPYTEARALQGKGFCCYAMTPSPR